MPIPAIANTTEKLTADDMSAMLHGANIFIIALSEVFPESPADDLLAKAREIEASPVAQELLHQVIILRKIKV